MALGRRAAARNEAMIRPTAICRVRCARGRFITQLTDPRARTHREGYDDVRVARAIQVNRAATRPRRIVQLYSVNVVDDVVDSRTTCGYSRPVINESSLTEYTYATSSAASRGLEWLDRW